MGMFDEVLCNNELFGEHRGETHQTKDLDPVFPGSTYEITPSGSLELLECTFEGWRRLAESLTPVFTGARRNPNYHSTSSCGPRSST